VLVILHRYEVSRLLRKSPISIIELPDMRSAELLNMAHINLSFVSLFGHFTQAQSVAQVEVPLQLERTKLVNAPDSFDTILTYKQKGNRIRTFWENSITGFDQSIVHLPPQEGFCHVTFMLKGLAIGSFVDIYRYSVVQDLEGYILVVFDISLEMAKFGILSNGKDFGKRSKLLLKLKFQVESTKEGVTIRDLSLDFPLHYMNLCLNTDVQVENIRINSQVPTIPPPTANENIQYVTNNLLAPIIEEY